MKNIISAVIVTLVLAGIVIAGTYSDNIDGIGWFNGTNLNVSDVRQDLNFNNKNISQVELVNGVNFTSAIISDYDYIIYQKPGSVYDCGSAIATCIISKNGSTQRIQNASSDWSTVLINTTSNMLKGKIYVKSGTYTPTQEINYTDGISIISDGAYLNVKDYNGIVFNITGEPFTEKSNNQTEISGFKVYGDLGNLNFWLVNATTIPRGLIIRDIYFGRVSNLISISGATFDADIGNVNGYFLNGTWIKLLSTDTLSVTNARIHDSELSNVGLNNSYNESIGIDIDSQGAGISGIIIDSVWIEYTKKCIRDNGTTTKISGSKLICYAGTQNSGTGIEVVKKNNYGSIFGNSIYLGSRGSIGINFTVPASLVGSVTGNNFIYGSNLYPNLTDDGILGENVSVAITGNWFYGGGAGNMATGVNLTNNTNLSTIITGNAFYGINKSIDGSFVGTGNTYSFNTYDPTYEMLDVGLNLNGHSLIDGSLVNVSGIDDKLNTTVNNSGLVLKIISDENYTNYTNPVLYDTSGFGNNGYWSGHNVPNFTTWKAGTPLKLDGTNDLLSMNANGSSLMIKGAITMSGWVRLTDTTVNQAFFGRGNSFGTGGANFGYMFSYFASTKKMFFDTYNLTTRDALSTSANAAGMDTDWHHYVATWDGTTGTNMKKIYIDGVQVVQGTSAISEIVPSQGYFFRIGQDGLGSSKSSAEFYDVRVYNRYMDADEVNRLYHSNPQDEKSSVIRGNITTFVNNSGYEKFSINQTGVFSNFTMPICSKSVVNQTGSTCFNLTSQALNTHNGSRWLWSGNGTEII